MAPPSSHTIRMVVLSLFAMLTSAHALRVLLFPVYEARRQALFDSVRDNLALADHNVTSLIFEEDVVHVHLVPPQTLLVTSNASAPYGTARQLQLWESGALVPDWTESLATAPAPYLSALADRCRSVLDDTSLLQQLRQLRADLLVTDMQGHDLCALTLAHKLSQDETGTVVAPPVVVAGVVAAARLPEALSHYTASPYHPLLIRAEEWQQSQCGVGGQLSALWSYTRRLRSWDAAYTAVALRVARDHLTSWPSDASQLYAQMSLVLLNGVVSVDTARPYYPSTVLVGGLTCKLATLLPKEIESFVRSYRAGAILVTLELTSVVGRHYPAFLLDSMLQGLGRLPYAVLWKVEASVTQGRELPKNFILEHQLSIQDVMGHGRSRLVVSLCSADTVFGAIFHSVPLLCLPVLEEQLDLARRITARGLALTLTLDKLTADSLAQSVTTLLTNASYKQAIRQYNELLRDHSDTPQDRLLFWLEYAARRKGASHLRNTAAIKMSYRHFFLFDALLLLLVLALLTLAAVAGTVLALLRNALNRRRLARANISKPKSE